MDDSLIYYLVIGAIYLLSKVFGKKKKQEVLDEEGDYEVLDTPRPPKKAAPTFEDILKELTGEAAPEFTAKEKSEPLEHAKSEPVLATDLVDYQKKNVEAVEPDELIDIVPHKPVERKKLEFQRDEHFVVEEENTEMADGIAEMLSDYDGVRRAMVLKEVLDRKY